MSEEVSVFPKRLIPSSEAEIMSRWSDYGGKPLVSICCATYNHVRYIEDALCGFFSQNTQYPFEVIVRDDCSNDGTTDVVRRYFAKYPLILKPVINEVNRLKSGERSFAAMMRLAKGKYIAVCEGDDYWIDANKLQKQVEFLERSPTYVITYSSSQTINDFGMVQDACHGSKRDLSSLELMKGSGIATLTACFRNKFLENEYPLDLLMAGYGDIALWAYLGQFGDGKYLESDRKSVYRVHAGGAHSSASFEKRAGMRMQTSFALYRYFKNVGNIELAKHHLKKLYDQTVDDVDIDIAIFRHKFSINKITKFFSSKFSKCNLGEKN